MIRHISSNQHSLIKRIKQLQQRKYRQKYSQYIVEGIRIINDALQNGAKIEYILFCDRLFEIADGEDLLQKLSNSIKNFDIYKLTDRLFEYISDTQTPQGIMAILSYQEFDLKDYIQNSKEFLIVLDRIQDPGNLGTIIRTADAVGADAVLMGKGCADIYNSKTIRSTMGSVFHLPVLQNIGDTYEIITLLKKHHFNIISTDITAEQYYYQVDYNKKIAIIIGNEGNGIAPEVLDISDLKVKIPIIGKAESLNASIAASIVLYEAAKQKYD